MLIIAGFWFLLRQNFASPAVSGGFLSAQDGDWTMGEAGAEVTLVEYVDFQCSACGAYHPLVKQLEGEYLDKVRFVTRHFPLTQIHSNAMLAAVAAEIAGKHGKFWEMRDILFERQQEWSGARNPKDFFVSYAEAIGIDRGKFLEDYERGDFAEKIKADINSGLRAGVQGTPTFFLNGEKIQNPRSFGEFKTLIEDALTKSNL